MADNVEKGRALERAVRFIQETILKSDPKLSGLEFSIETNKVLTGVRHEIDVLVKTLPNSFYEATWIFECKNWKSPVGKNEVIILAEKVDVLRANRGFLVAKTFTRDAEEQLNRDNRLSFIECTDDFLSPLNSLELVHTVHEPQNVEVRIKERGVPHAEHPGTLDWKGKICRVNNRPMDFPLFLKQQIDGILFRDQKENSAKYQLEGTYSGERAELIEFDAGEFLIEEMEVEHMVLIVRFTVIIRRRKVFSKFELKGHGRTFSFEPIEDFIPGKQLQIDIVQRI
jgi:hypothetical protein